MLSRLNDDLQAYHAVLPPDQEMRGRHEYQQPSRRVADARFDHHRCPSAMHRSGFSAHGTLIRITDKIRAELDRKGEWLGATVDGAARPVHAGEGSRGVRQGKQRPGVKHASELLQLWDEGHLCHCTLACNFNNTKAYQFYKSTPDTLLGPGE